MEFKGKSQRAECYKNRDAYFDCIEKQQTTEGTQAVACKQLLELFEKSCGKKWAEHFIRKRDYTKFKERIEKEGTEAIDSKKI